MPNPRRRRFSMADPATDLFTTAELKGRCMRPRAGEVPLKLDAYYYGGSSSSRKRYYPLWRLDQAVMIMPRGCSLALASAIEGYNAAPTHANMDKVRVLITMS